MRTWVPHLLAVAIMTTVGVVPGVTAGTTAGARPGVVPAAAAAARVSACGPRIDAPLPDPPWPLRRLRPDLVWPLTRGRGIVVAVIDSGVSDAHPALAGQVLPGYDFVTPGENGTCDEVGHGTMIAGIIAGVSAPSSGFHGLAPEAKILPVRVLASADRSFATDLPGRIAAAIRLATDSGADIINLSLTTVPVPELADAVHYAIAHDVVVVAAAGNEGSSSSSSSDEPEYPAAYDGVIAVAGVDANGDHVQTSTRGDYVDVAGPGAQIEGPAPQGGGYAVNGGTSFAAAYVSGVAALVRAYRPDLTAALVARRILRTADRPPGGWDRDVGAGVVNPYWAVVSVAAEEEDQGPPGSVALPERAADALGGTRVTAAWTALIAVALSGLVLVSVWVVRSGRRRHWRPGRPRGD